VGEYLHVVPTATRNERGVWVPAQSPLEAVVSIRGGGRFPRPVLRDLQEAVERASGYQVLVAWQPFSNGMQPRIVENFEGVKARGKFGDSHQLAGAAT